MHDLPLSPDVRARSTSYPMSKRPRTDILPDGGAEEEVGAPPDEYGGGGGMDLADTVAHADGEGTGISSDICSRDNSSRGSR